MKALNPIAAVAELFRALPGVGPRMAERIAYHIVKSPPSYAARLAHALTHMKETIRYCSICSNFTEADLCDICRNPARDRTVICIVEDVHDMRSIESMRYFDGVFHILHGSLSPLEGIGPQDLTIAALLERIKTTRVRELILATNPTVEGEATATYIYQIAKPCGVRITRIAQGVPRGGDLEYTDGLTLKRAFEGRTEMA